MAETSKACWTIRGCEGIEGLYGMMKDECPHGRTDCYSPCKIDCHFAQCTRPTHKVAKSFDLLLDPTVDRNAAIKEGCRVCEFFLTHGPRIGETESSDAPESAIATDIGVSINLF